jgi:glutamate dehydrogenase/leucine dehydrogenase
MEYAITGEIARNINCDVIFETTNGELTPESSDLFSDTDVLHNPDFLAYSIGVQVSYHEQIYKYMRFCWF